MRARLLDEFGSADLSATQLGCIETFAMAFALERFEFLACIRDPHRDPSRFIGVSNLTLGSARTLGLKRPPKAVNLADYLEARAEQIHSADAPRRKTRKPRRGHAHGA